MIDEEEDDEEDINIYEDDFDSQTQNSNKNIIRL